MGASRMLFNLDRTIRMATLASSIQAPMLCIINPNWFSFQRTPNPILSYFAGLQGTWHHLWNGVLRPGAVDAQSEGVALAPMVQLEESPAHRQRQQQQRHSFDAGAARQVLGTGAQYTAGECAWSVLHAGSQWSAGGTTLCPRLEQCSQTGGTALPSRWTALQWAVAKCRVPHAYAAAATEAGGAA